MNQANERFRAIRQHYARNADAQRLRQAHEWAIDAYAWDHEAHITLTPIEAALWADIRAEGAVLYPQFPVGRFFVDFGNPAARVAIECDGAAWHRDAQHDAERQRQIEALGWTVYRIPGRVCLTDFREVEDPNTGKPSVAPCEARNFIRDVCARHPIRIGGRP